MDLSEILEEMNRRLKTDAFKLDEQRSCRLSVGDGPVVEILEFPDQGRVLLYASLGPEPVEGKDEFYRLLMRSMFLFKDTLGCTFALDPETDFICLQRTDYLDRLTPDSFYELFEGFCNLADNWNEMLNGFRPALEAAVALRREADGKVAGGLADGTFLRV